MIKVYTYMLAVIRAQIGTDTFYVHTDPDSLPSFAEECSFGNWSSGKNKGRNKAFSVVTEQLHLASAPRSLQASLFQMLSATVAPNPIRGFS